MAPQTEALNAFLTLCSAEITRRTDALAARNGEFHNQLSVGASAFAAALPHALASPIERPPSTVPVTKHLAELPPGPLTSVAAGAVDDMPWIASHRMTDGGEEAALAPLNEVRDFGDVTVGMLLLRPKGRYPEHHHPPHELYLPIADGGRWRVGGNDSYEELPPDSLVYNNPNDVHGSVAGESPLLALYVLWD